MQIYRISSEFSTHMEYDSFDKNVGEYWDDLESAKNAIEKWLKSGGHYLFGEWEGRKVNSINVWFEKASISLKCENACNVDEAVNIIAQGEVSEQKHLGYEHSTKTIIGPDGDEYSRSVKIDKGYEWINKTVNLIFDIKRLTLNGEKQ